MQGFSGSEAGVGRELFGAFRRVVGHADAGATIFAAACLPKGSAHETLT
jgi:hypothetical protein